MFPLNKAVFSAVICPEIVIFDKIASLTDVSFMDSVCNYTMAHPADKLSSFHWLFFVLIQWIDDICTRKCSKGLIVCDSSKAVNGLFKKDLYCDLLSVITGVRVNCFGQFASEK